MTTKKRARNSEEPVKEEEKTASEPEEEEEDEPVTKRGRKNNGKAASPKPKKTSATKKKADATSPKKAKGKEPAPDASASEAESAASEAEVSDTEKPAINKKARKELQEKLTKAGKDVHPYPDWPAGSPVPYAALTKTFTLIEATTKRLEKLSHTSLFLRQVLRLTPDELLLVIHLMINRLAADYEGVELGIGESLLMKAICESCGRTMAKLKEDHKETGDLGEVAMKSRNTQKTLFAPKQLTVKSVHAGLKDIATTQGSGGQGRKVAGIKKLLSAAQGDEAKYLVRGLEGKLRLGLAEKTVIVGLSQAVVVHEAEKAGKKAPSLDQMQAAEAMLKEVYSELPNYEIIIPEMMKAGIMNLKDTCKLQPGVPLKPMLAKPTKAISEVLDRFEGKQFTCEYKYDGERVQIHYVAPNSSIAFPTIDPAKGIAKIFSRNSEELSPKYPDILGALNNWVKPGVESFVLDCEAVAWDRDEKRVLPFQQLMTRKKKDVAIEDVKVRVCVFGFDLLFLNGKVPSLPFSLYPPLTL
jgi:DNA ligase-1